jgi:hypothetical protein
MDAGLAGLIGAAIGSLAGVLVAVVNGWLQHRKETAQWKRQLLADSQKWERDNAHKAYTDCLTALSNYRILYLSQRTSHPDSDEAMDFAKIKPALLQDAIAKTHLVLLHYNDVHDEEVSSIIKMLTDATIYERFSDHVAVLLISQVSILAMKDRRIIQLPDDQVKLLRQGN